MGARLRIFLTPQQEHTLEKIRHSNNLCSRVKKRAEAICLNHHGWYVEKIATYLHWNVATVRKTLNQWQKQGLDCLYEKGNRGRKQTWKESDIEYLEEILKQDERTYNSKQLANKLEKETGVKLTADHLRQLLKKRCGNEVMTESLPASA